MKIVCVSDTHLMHERRPLAIPDGDLLIHAGDALAGGDLEELRWFARWIGSLPHRGKIYVPGNHDVIFEQRPDMARAELPKDVVCLIDEETIFEGLRIYGSPWQPEFCDWAFNLPRGHRLREKWNRIPSGVDVLVTHGPPLGILDLNMDGDHVGCRDLREVMPRIRPRLHVFGHIHLSYGSQRVGSVLHVNASVCDEAYRPSQRPIVVETAAPEWTASPPGEMPAIAPLRTTTRPLW